MGLPLPFLYCYVETMVGIGPVELALLAVVVALVAVLVAGTGRHRAATFARRAGLTEVTPELVRRVTRRRRFVVAGTLLGIAATGPLDLWLVPAYAGLALGAVADAVTRPGPPPGGPRVARATTARITDYVPPWLVGVAVAAAALAPLLALLRAVAPRADVDTGPVARLTGAGAGWLVLAAAAGLAVSLGLARVVVGRRQPAGSAAELAADDALRAQGVRDVLHVTAVTSFSVGWALSLRLLEPDVTGLARRVGGAVPLLLLVGLAAVGWTHELTGGPRHWRRRLVAA
jgi:hypothetical protein